MASTFKDLWMEYNEGTKLANDINVSLFSCTKKNHYIETRLYILESMLFKNKERVEPQEGHAFIFVNKDEPDGKHFEHLEESVISTKHIALTVNKELDPHTRLINNLDQHVEFTGSRILDAA
ncbi:Syntaxin-51 [Bienertia sinuspersici]